MPNSCEKCKKNVTASRNPGLSCFNCNKYWHSGCAELSDKAFQDLTDNKFSWSCNKCKRRSNILPAASHSSSLSPSTAIASDQQSQSSKASVSTITQKTRKKAASGATQSTPELVARLEDLLNSALLRIDQLETQVGELINKSLLSADLTDKVQSLVSKTASIDKQLNEDTLEIQGLPRSALDLPLISVITVGKEIGCEISQDDLVSVPVKSASIISISFKSKAKRRNFLIAGKKFNKDKKKVQIDQQSFRIHVNEPLTDHQRKLYRDTKVFASAHNYKFVWVGLSGLIYLKKSEGDIPHSIISSESLKKLSNENLLPELPRPQNKGTAMSSSISTQ